MTQDLKQIEVTNPEPPDPMDDPGYQKLVSEMAVKCRCQPDSARPCDGLLAGGLCDDINWREGLDDDDSEPLRDEEE